jgi:hypothetical protein
MAQLFARVELRGTPGEETYQKLHQYMFSKNWFQQINGYDLPHATYQANSVAAEPNLMAMANELKTEIERRIWTKALILMVRSADWAKTAG